MSSPILTTQVQFRRGSASENATLLGGTGELTVDLTNKRVIVHLGDGLLGGYTGANLNDLNSSINLLSGFTNNNFATRNNLTQTGILLINRDNSISGVLNTKISSSSGALSTTIANTGQQLWIITNNNGSNLSGNLYNTGNNLYRYITGLSGVINTINPNVVNVVYTTGNQVLAGIKTFNNTTLFLDYISINGLIVNGTNDSQIDIINSQLIDNQNPSVSVDWNNRVLTDNGTNTTLDWQNHILTGAWNVESIYVSGSRVITSAQTGGFGGGMGTYNQSGSYLFRTTPVSGINKQFINFPATLDNNPYVISSLNNVSGISNIFVQTSGITSSGYWAQYSNTIDNSGYVLTTLASLSANTGLATTVIVQNYYLSGDAPFVVYTTGNQSIYNSKSFNISGAETFSVNKRGSDQAIVVTSDPYVYINYTGGITFISTEQAYINSKDDSYKIKFDNNNYGVVYGDWRLSDSPTQPNSISTKGYVDSGVSGSYPRLGNPSGFISGFNSGIYITSGQTGQFYASSNPSGFISGFNSGIYITTGQTGKFYSNTNPSGFINSGLLTGTLWPPTQNYNININWASANTFWHILTGVPTFNFSNQRDGQTIAVSVSNTGLANYTGIWPSTIKWPGQTVPSQTSGSFTDIYTFLDITGMIYGSIVQNF